jgi:hypothetical protein
LCFTKVSDPHLVLWLGLAWLGFAGGIILGLEDGADRLSPKRP